MSMTYYAVTDDPNELAHFGILGMKWGRRRTPEQLGHPRHSGSRRPRSAAYQKAQSKLGLMMKSGIEKAKASWRTYNSPYAKEERFMKKAMQQARNGTLKYGKLTDDQVQRVTDRLYLERQARQLGSTENPSFGKRIKTAIGEGVVRGIGQGTGAYIEERFRGRGRTTAEIKGDKRMAKYESSRAGRRAARRKAKADINEEYYKTAYEEGDSSIHTLGARNRAKYLSDIKSQNKKKDYERSVQESYDKQLARNRANSDDTRDNARILKIRNSTDNGERKLGSGNALKNLNAWNEVHENVNKHGNAYLDSMNTDLARIRRQKNEAAERSYARNQVLQEYARAQRQRAHEAEIVKRLEANGHSNRNKNGGNKRAGRKKGHVYYD